MALVLVSVLGLCSLVLLLVKDGLVQVVKECSRRKDEEGRGLWQQAEEWAPLRMAGECGVDADLCPARDLSEGLGSSENAPH